MPESGPFHTGRYHLSRARQLKDRDERNSAIQGIRNFYVASSNLIKQQGWRSPLTLATPSILQMGIEGYYTANTFINFVHKRNPDAIITIADFSDIPLKECREKGLEKKKNVNLVKADTTELPFSDNSFDLIETTGLLQHLTYDQKITTINEWYQVLKPGGIITTRDWAVSIKEKPEQWDRLNQAREYYLIAYGVMPYATTTEVLQYIFTSQGFLTVFQPEFTVDPLEKIYHQIIAKKPEATANT